MLINRAKEMARMLAEPECIRWAAPVRTLRQICGLRPARISLIQAKRILVIRPDGIGDFVLTSAFLRELRRAAPQAHITLLVKVACYDLARNCPYADRVERLDFRPGGSWRRRLKLILAAWNLRWKRMQFRGFDLVLFPRRGFDCYGAELVGHALAGRGQLMVHREEALENPVDFETWSNPCTEHEVLHNLRFLRWCGASDPAEVRLELWLSPEDEQVARAMIKRFGDERKLCAIAPGAGGKKRIWPAENFARVVRVLCEDLNFNVVVVGGSDAAEFGTRMEAEIPRHVLNTAGRLTTRQSAALLQRCQITITNDSGPMHMAAAVSSQIVVISCHPLGGNPDHSNSPVRFGPWGAIHRVLQPVPATVSCEAFCSCRHCIGRVSPEQVLDAVKQLMAGQTVV